MTNAERYLKDGVDIKEIADGIEDAILGHCDEEGWADSIYRWFSTKTKPSLTENENAILRSIPKGFKSIMRNEHGNLKLITCFGSYCDFWVFNGLFQFIKNGEEYIIKELLGG